MAGDWIKIETGLHQKPETLLLAKELNCPVDLVIGLLHRFWSWSNKSSTNGRLELIDLAMIDEVIRHDGFGKAMRGVGWLDEDEEGLYIPNFDRHNSQSAKKRALEQERKRRQRDVTVTSRQCPTEGVTREEKRKVNSSSVDPKGFAAWWAIYPRKVGKKKCRQIWSRDNLEDRSAELIELLKRQVSQDPAYSKDRKFIPHPSSYLNQGRYEDEIIDRFQTAPPP